MPSKTRQVEDLGAWAATTRKRVLAEGDDGLYLDKKIFSKLPDRMTSDEMILHVGWSSYQSWTTERVHWWGTKESFASLGLVIVACMLESRGMELEILHPDSGVRLLRIDTEWFEQLHEGAGLEVQPVGLQYMPDEELDEYPFSYPSVYRDFLPKLRIANRLDDLATIGEDKPRDCVIVDGNLQGTAQLAHLLLDLGQEGNRQAMVTLECEAGSRGVAPWSHEVRFYVPELPELAEHYPPGQMPDNPLESSGD